MRTTILIPSILIALAFSPARAIAQSSDSPQAENARLDKKILTGNLATEVKAWAVKADGPQWLGYAVPQIGRDRMMCCGNDNGSWGDGCGHCRLEDHDPGTNMTSRDQAGTAKLEALRSIAVLFRAENKRITKIASFRWIAPSMPADCLWSGSAE